LKYAGTVITALVKSPSFSRASSRSLRKYQGLQHLGREVPSTDRRRKDRFAHLPLDELSHPQRLEFGRLDRRFADDDSIPIEKHRAGRDRLAFGIRHRPGPPRVVYVGQDRVGSEIDPDSAPSAAIREI
jgi:hypothetical protein